MSAYIPARLVQEVRKRARNHCEYCLLPENCQEASFHVDHVVPRSHGGTTTLDNLALACVSCSLRKSARRDAPDPRTGRSARLFNPRHDKWADHFVFLRRWRLRGRTPIGRATIAALHMNRPVVVAIRVELAGLGYFPPTHGQ